MNIQEYHKRYRAEHLEHIKKMQADWFQKNKVRRTAADKAWRKANPDKVAKYKQSLLDKNI